MADDSHSLPHWHVLGAGAIGCLFANALHQSGHPVSLILRQNASATARVTVDMTAQESQNALLQAGTATDSAPIDHLLITTKSYDVLAAVESVAPRLQQGCQLLLLVNGMGLAQQLQALLPHVDIYCGTTTHGAYKIAARHIVHAGVGETRVGKMLAIQGGNETTTQAPPAWFGHFAQAMPNSHWETHIDSVLWAKLAVNCVINPLTALHDCRNGELAQRPELAAQVEILCKEIIQVSYAAGFTQTAQTLNENVAKVIQTTAANHSSMLQDIRNRRNTEIRDITGYLLKEAARYAIPAPHNTLMLERILNHAV